MANKQKIKIESFYMKFEQSMLDKMKKEGIWGTVAPITTNDIGLARILGVSKQLVSKWRSEGTIKAKLNLGKTNVYELPSVIQDLQAAGYEFETY